MVETRDSHDVAGAPLRRPRSVHNRPKRFRNVKRPQGLTWVAKCPVVRRGSWAGHVGPVCRKGLELTQEAAPTGSPVWRRCACTGCPPGRSRLPRPAPNPTGITGRVSWRPTWAACRWLPVHTQSNSRAHRPTRAGGGGCWSAVSKAGDRGCLDGASSLIAGGLEHYTEDVVRVSVPRGVLVRGRRRASTFDRPDGCLHGQTWRAYRASRAPVPRLPAYQVRALGQRSRQAGNAPADHGRPAGHDDCPTGSAPSS